MSPRATAASGSAPVRRTPKGVPIIDRTIALLEFLQRTPDGASLSDIGRAIDVPKNTVYRMLNSLVAHGYLRRDDDSMRFRLSRKFALLGSASGQDQSLIEEALGPMRRLRDDLRETVVLSILDDQEGIVLEEVQGLHPFRFVCDPGTRQALHTSASTKSILAFLPTEDCETALRRVVFEAHTARTITHREAFMRELQRVRLEGFARDEAEALDGVHCLAAPIFDRRRRPIAAVTVTGPAERMPASQFATLGARIKTCAVEISERLGGHRKNEAGV